jgi:hypothetical protein
VDVTVLFVEARRLVLIALVALALVGCKKKIPPASSFTCQSDDDCAISCVGRDDCCGSCTCNIAMHKKEQGLVLAAYDENCGDRPDCPQKSCAEPIEEYFARCRSGRCVTESSPIAADPAPAAPEPAAELVLPSDVQAFIEKREECDHWRGEEPYDEARREEINAGTNKTCTGTDAALAAMKRKYESNVAVTKRLADFDSVIE